MKSEQSVAAVVSILGVACVIGILINPAMASLEVFVLAVIAAYLSGIYIELKHSNKKPKDEPKQ